MHLQCAVSQLSSIQLSYGVSHTLTENREQELRETQSALLHACHKLFSDESLRSKTSQPAVADMLFERWNHTSLSINKCFSQHCKVCCPDIVVRWSSQVSPLIHNEHSLRRHYWKWNVREYHTKQDRSQHDTSARRQDVNIVISAVARAKTARYCVDWEEVATTWTYVYGLRFLVLVQCFTWQAVLQPIKVPKCNNQTNARMGHEQKWSRICGPEIGPEYGHNFKAAQEWRNRTPNATNWVFDCINIHPPIASLSKFTPFCFEGFSSYEDILYFTTRCRPIPWANLSHHRVEKFAITTITDGKPINRWRKPIQSVFPSTCSCFTTGKDTKNLITCVMVVWRNCGQSIFSPSIFCRSLSGTAGPLRRRK